MRGLRNILTAAAILISSAASADKGFWPIQDINHTLEKDMRERGIKLRPKEIYNVESPGSGLADAVLTFGFKYSGCFVSNWGLVLTSADPAIDYMARLGEVGQQLLKEGFHAVSDDREIPLEGEKVYSLKRVFDVTEDVKTLLNRGMEYAEVVSKIEKAYEESTTVTCRLSSEWAGEKYYISAYKVYDDVRLVVMPPLSMSRAGDVDGKWSWPTPRCDFALFRIYDHGRPVSGAKCLDVCLDGYTSGAFMMTIGYPRLTERYVSSVDARFREGVSLPLTNSIRGARLEIMRLGMDGNPSVRSKYSERASELEESLNEGKRLAAYYKSSGLVGIKENGEGWMPDGLMSGLRDAFESTTRVEYDKLLRTETIQNGTFAASYLRRAASAGSLDRMKEILLAGSSETDPGVEKELLGYALSEYYTNMDDLYFGPYQRWIQDRFGYDFDAAADYLWEGSLLSSPSKIMGMEDMSEIKDDLLYRFLSDTPISLYDGRSGHKEGLDKARSLSGEYMRTLYLEGLRKGTPIYPDANSTMRLTYGTIGPLQGAEDPQTGWYTIPSDFLRTLDQADPYKSVTPRLKQLIEKDFWSRWGFKVGGKGHRMMMDFISSNDFVDGCQGSPILDAEGHLIGVVSGGTPETKTGILTYQEGRSASVSTDMHLVLWYLDRALGLKRIVKEFEFY